jgi:hypothetical protein
VAGGRQQPVRTSGGVWSIVEKYADTVLKDLPCFPILKLSRTKVFITDVCYTISSLRDEARVICLLIKKRVNYLACSMQPTYS